MEAKATARSSEPQHPRNKEEQVLDGSEIMRLVGNEEVFTSFVDHKFKELDKDRDGQLSVQELQPAVADIGAALGLPAKGSSPDSDHIYSEVSLCLSFSLLSSCFAVPLISRVKHAQSWNFMGGENRNLT